MIESMSDILSELTQLTVKLRALSKDIQSGSVRIEDVPYILNAYADTIDKKVN